VSQRASSISSLFSAIAASSAVFGDKLGPLFTAEVVLILAGLALAVTNRSIREQAAPHE